MLAKSLLFNTKNNVNILRRAAIISPVQAFGFTRSFRKILLTEDVPNLGFKGEWAFVKPGFAFNKLVPEGKALFATDPAALQVKVDMQALK